MKTNNNNRFNLFNLKISFVHAIFILTAFFLLNGCEPGNKVKVESFSPEGEVPTLVTFTVEFSENLAPADKQDVWLSDEFIKFEPKIKGKFKWLSPSKLIFSPDEALEPSQSYKAEITKSVLFNTTFSPDFKSYSFNTPLFEAKKANIFWTNIANQYYKLSVQANLQFNYAVLPDQLKKFIEVRNNGRVLNDFHVVTQNSSDLVSINLGEIQQTDKEQNVVITVKRGLESVTGKEPLKKNIVFKSKLPPITELEITGAASGFDGSTAWIEVGTTQMVDEKTVKNFVSVYPSKNLKFAAFENSFKIEGDFSNLQTIELKIKQGLQGLYGGTLKEDFQEVVSLVDISPSINFADKKGSYLMLRGEKNLQINAVNVPGVDIEVSQVFKNNILFFLSQFSYYDYYDDWGYYNPSYYTGNYGRVLYNETVNLENRRNWLEKFSINLNRVAEGKMKGIFVINAYSTEERWVSDSKIIALSDLAIIAKKSSNELVVFINSIKDAEPVGDVEVNLISTNNQTLLSGKTNKEGVVRFLETKSKLDGFTPAIITAEKDDDFNYIDLKKTFIETSRFNVEGSHEVSDNYLTFIYPDRDIYRPGETVNLSAIVRTADVKLPGDFPVIVKVINPQGKTYEEFKKNLDNEGSFELSFQMPEYAQTGEYVIEVYSGTSMLIGANKISIEDFVPDKIRVNVATSKKMAFRGETVPVKLNAEFLFGAKASGLKYEASIQLNHKPYRSKQYSDFDFASYSTQDSRIENVFLDGILDEQGNADVNYIVPTEIESGGIVNGNAYVSVFDLTGRTVSRVANFEIFTKKFFIGLKRAGSYYNVNQQINFQFAAVDFKDQPVKNFDASVSLIRYEWRTVLKKDYSDRYFYASEEKEIVEWEREINLNGGKKDFSFAVSKSGKYELRIAKKGDKNYVKSSFYAYGWTSTTASSFEVDKEGRVEIVFDKETYKPGDKAKVLFIGPFSGKLLVTVDKNGVLYNKYINMENNSARMEIPVFDTYMPNVYVTATLFKKHGVDNTTPFLVGHGFASMKVDKPGNKLPVEITAPTKIKPNSKHEIVIKTIPSRNVHVTLAAVDEGILQIKNFVTPDPYGFMYAKRSLKVESYNLYKLLLPEILSLRSSTGGDEMGMEQFRKRTNPITTKRFNLFAFWSGVRKTDANGIVRIPLNMNQFNGEVRLMAVAYTGSRFGSAESSIKVADDLIIEPEMPRFLATNDNLSGTVTLVNTTSTKGEVTVSIKTEGAVTLASASSQKVTVNANSTKPVNFTLKTGAVTGKGKVIIETSGIAKVKEEIDIAVRPVSPLVVESGSSTITAGKDLQIKIPGGFIEGTQNSKITISKFPAIKFAKHLKSLINYPYGCIEQTVSTAFPQLYLEELAKLASPESFATNSPSFYVKEAIKKVESMQLYDGSLSYWPGEPMTSWWGSVYAAHFLLEAKKAGFAVSQPVLNRLLAYVAKRGKEYSTYEYVSYQGNSRVLRTAANKEILYSLYVLALAGRGDISSMNYYKARPQLITGDSKYFLAGAYALMGQWNSYYQIIPKKFTPEKTVRESGGSFDSEIRANAIMLNILFDIEPGNSMIPSMIKYLAGFGDRLYSTQEQSFFFLAMGKAARKAADSKIKADIVVDGKTLKSYTGQDLTISNNTLNGKTVTIKATGKGEVYLFWSSEGIKKGGVVQEKDKFMSVRREFYDYRTGQRINDNSFKQGQMIVAKLVLTAESRSAENIVITDMLPACFEIENPRLSALSGSNWSNSSLNVQYVDIRDDRLLLFTNLDANSSKDFYYLLRVVNAGSFSLPVISAEAMYDPEINSYNGAGRVGVSKF